VCHWYFYIEYRHPVQALQVRVLEAKGHLCINAGFHHGFLGLQVGWRKLLVLIKEVLAGN
jgi:hypothetical protein